VRIDSGGTCLFIDDGATANTYFATARSGLDDGVWHKLDFVRVSSTERYGYVDGVLDTKSTTDAGSISSSGNLPLTIGNEQPGAGPATAVTISLAHLSVTAPTATQVRQMYDAEKGMFVASAECLLQSGSTDDVLDVDVDPLTSKVIVTQTDAITIFDELVVDSKPTVNSGSSEKGKLWGDLRAEQNSANAYVTAPTTDQRQVNEMVRGLASDLPKGVDLSKAKAWVTANSASAISSSYNIKSITDNGTGDYDINFAIPFKSTGYVTVGNTGNPAAGANGNTVINIGDGDGSRVVLKVTTGDTGNVVNDAISVVAFGELENE
jgi:hypothetical protein